MQYIKKPGPIAALQYAINEQYPTIEEAQDAIADFVGQNTDIIGDAIVFQSIDALGDEWETELLPGQWVLKIGENEFRVLSDEPFREQYQPFIDTTEQARKWDELEDAVAEFYESEDEDGNEVPPKREGDLTDIGELCARKLGFM